MIENSIEQEKSLTLHTCTGLISAEDIEKEIRLLYKNGPTDNHLWDLTNADLSSLDNIDIRKLAELPVEIVPNRKGRKTALVAGTDLEFGLSRMYATHSEYQGPLAEIRVFRSIEEAKKWIDEN